MAVVAYLRVSTEKQFLENQREEIIRFAEKNGLSIDRWYMDCLLYTSPSPRDTR